MTRRFWSNVFAIAFKEARVLRNDTAVLVMMLVQPVIMVLLFGGVVSNTPAHTPWGVLDRSATETSRRLVEAVQTTGYFVPPRPVWSYRAAEALLARGRAVGVLVVPDDFERAAARGEARVQLLLDGSEPLTAARVGGIVSSVAATFRPDGAMGGGSAAPIDVRQRFRFNPTLKDSIFYLAAISGMLLTNLCLSASSGGLVAERENGTYEQLLSLPTTALELVLGKLVPYVGLCYFVLALTSVLAGGFFGVWPRGSFLVLAIAALPFVLASLAIGVLVSTIAHTTTQSVFLTVFFILPSMVLSGIMLPYHFMPHPVREIGALLPLRWYGIASRRIVARGAGLVDVLVPMAVLLTIFAVLLAIVRWRMKPRLG
jgi:ABC-2 type transport system permease protein